MQSWVTFFSLKIIFCEFINEDATSEQEHTVLVTSKELVKENPIIQKKKKAIGSLKRIAEERLPFIRFES